MAKSAAERLSLAGAAWLDSARGRWSVVLLGGLIWAVALWWITPTVSAGLDLSRIVEPYGEFFRQRILHGELPWWNPYASLGRPFLVDLQAAAFYPPTWLVIPLGLRGGWFAATVLHGALAVWGFLRLGRLFGVSGTVALGCACCCLFSAPFFSRMQAGQVNYVYSLCYLPLVLDLAVRYALGPTRRGWVVLALIWALQLLCCHPQVFWLSALGAGLFVTGCLLQRPWRLAWQRWWRAAAGLFAACAAGVALLGFVLVPFLQLAEQSNRAEPSLAFSAAFGMQGVHWLSLVSAARGGFAVNWEYDLHVGLLVLLGGALGLGRMNGPLARGALALALGGAVIAAGNSTPLFAGFYEFLPGLASFRVPARAGALLVLGLVLGAASTVAAPPRSPGWRVALVVLAGLVAVTLIAAQGSLRDQGVFLGWGLGLLVLAASAWLYLLHPATDRPAGPVWVLAVVALIEIGLAVRGWKRLPQTVTEFPVEQLVRRVIHDQRLDRQIAPVRVALSAALLRENSGMIHGYATPVGFESLSLARVWTYLHRVAGVDPTHAYNTSPDGGIYDVAPRLDSMSLAITLPRDSGSLVVRPQPDPRAYLVTQFRRVPDWRAAIAEMVNGHPIHQVALVEAAHADQLPGSTASGASGTARIDRFSLNSVEVDVDTPDPALLVLAEAWYPGWQAGIDGREARCIPANGWMRSVLVPAGRHRVRFVYRQERLVPGCLLSLAAGALLGGLYFWRPARAQGHAA